MSSAVTIEDFSHDGRGVTRIDGKTVFVFNALPKETVEIEILKRHARFDEAIATNILSPHHERIEPRCDNFARCGGCRLQHVSQNEQIRFKERVLLNHLKHFGKITPEQVLPPLFSESYGYRSRARYSVDESGNLGFRGLLDPSEVIRIETCPILSPALEKLLVPLQQILRELQLHKFIYQIDVAASEEVSIVFYTTISIETFIISRLKAFGKEHKISLYEKSNNKILSIENNARPLSLTVTDDISLSFFPTDFTQVNRKINRMMISKAIELLNISREDHIVDLFCGIGNFTLPIAQKCDNVIGIEGSSELVLRARENAQANKINAKFEVLDLKKWPITLLLKNCTKLLIDPPRSGAKNVVASLPEKIERIVYVSCNPATLARDAFILKGQGFLLKSVMVMDMFSHTEHVEAMALFVRN